MKNQHNPDLYNTRQIISCFCVCICAGILFLSFTAGAQSVSISPSRLYYKAAVGEYKTQEISITNNASVRQSFAVTFGDFEPAGIEGKSRFLDAGESPNSCSRWLSATPSFFELDPGQIQKIQVLIQVPATPEANKVKWAAMRIKLTKEKQEKNLSDNKAIGLGVTETFQFVVHIFQTPPTVTSRSVEIVNFRESETQQQGKRVLVLKTHNTGEAIADCASYLEFTNTGTGKEVRIKPFAFTLLPDAVREVKFIIPDDLEKGHYSVMGVVDYGSRENVQAAEMELDIQ
ncbi:MAG: hypothetical protein IT242_07550 [Bacteroidia bacterium]|nr:hypothetical protein [Bacteroidia bacterium]